MNIYLWKNDRSDSQFEKDYTEEGMRADHSACLVILAESAEEAHTFAKKEGYEEEIRAQPIIIGTEQKGIVVHSDGDC